MKDAKAIFLNVRSDEINLASGDLWTVAGCFRKGSCGKDGDLNRVTQGQFITNAVGIKH